jgi:hypothetical protein
VELFTIATVAMSLFIGTIGGDILPRSAMGAWRWHFPAREQLQLVRSCCDSDSREDKTAVCLEAHCVHAC